MDYAVGVRRQRAPSGHIDSDPFCAIPTAIAGCPTPPIACEVSWFPELENEAEDRALAVASNLLPFLMELAPLCPSIEHVILMDNGEHDRDALARQKAQVWSYESLLESHGEPTVWGNFDEQTPAGLCYTSGTTGQPKGVLYTHRSNYLHTLHALQANAMALTGRDVVLIAVPMFHANAWGLPYAAPAVGAKLVLPGRHTDGASLTAIIARPDEKWGERPVLIVESRNGQTFDAEALFSFLRGKMAGWWLPEQIVRIAAMPLAATGKIDKRKLRADYASGEIAAEGDSYFC